MRLGWGGSYTTRKQEALHAQREFLSAVETHAPHVVRELAQKPFGAYKLLYDSLPDESTEFGASKRYGFIGGWENFKYADEYTLPSRRNVRDALLVWAGTYHLEARWVFDDALSTLHMWCQFRYDGRFFPVGEMAKIPYEPDFTLTIRYADLKIKTIEEEMKRFDDEYKRARNTYFAEAEARYKQWGKEAEVRLELKRHLELFVLYRCCGIPVSEPVGGGDSLEGRYGLRSKTIYGALKEVCELLALPYWKRPAGRPPKIV